jgi:hypothetical protein
MTDRKDPPPNVDSEGPTQPAMHAVRVPLGSEPVPAWAQYLVARIDDLGTKFDSLFEDKKSTNVRLTELETRFDKLEGGFDKLENAFIERSKKHSDGIRKGSDTDMKHESVIADVLVKVSDHDARFDALEQKTDAQTLILERLDKIAESPVVKRTAYAIAMALLAYLVSKGH